MERHMRTNRARPSLLSARSDGIPQPFEQDESSRFTEPDTLLDDRRPRRLQKKPPYQETPKRSSQSWSRAWLLEILSCITSIVCLVGVVILLKQYDQQPVPALPLGITLNTLLGLLDYYVQGRFCLSGPAGPLTAEMELVCQEEETISTFRGL